MNKRTVKLDFLNPEETVSHTFTACIRVMFAGKG